ADEDIVIAIENERSVVAECARRQRAIAVVVADLDGSAGSDRQTSQDGAVRVIEDQRAGVHRDSGAEIVASRFRESDRGRSIFYQSNWAGNFADSVQRVVQNAIVEVQRGWKTCAGQVYDVGPRGIVKGDEIEVQVRYRHAGVGPIQRRGVPQIVDAAAP